MSGKTLRKVPRLSTEVKRIVAADVQSNWSRVALDPSARGGPSPLALCVERAIADSGQT